jgi:hypothetical protein
MLPLRRSGPVIEVSCFSGTQLNRCDLLRHLRTETDPVSETLCFLVSRTTNDEQSPKTQ